MTQPDKRNFSDRVTVDPNKLQWQIQQRGVSKSRFADLVEIDRSSIYRMLRVESVRRSTVEQVAQKLRIPIQDLLPDSSEPTVQTGSLPWHHPEWELVEGTLMPLVSMSNGLVMRTAQVRHRLLGDELGRGKLYDINGMPQSVRAKCHQALTRHAEICRRLCGTPFLAENLTMTCSPDQTMWMSVDRWFANRTLIDVVANKLLNQQQLTNIMRGIGTALHSLHEHRIVYRELHPSRILISDSGESQLTDLDLAKILAVEGSVSHDWLRSEFRAPEVAGGESHPQADLYSFAVLYAWVLRNGDRDEELDPQAVLTDNMPACNLREQLLQSLSPVWHQRPRSLVKILREIPA